MLTRQELVSHPDAGFTFQIILKLHSADLNVNLLLCNLTHTLGTPKLNEHSAFSA